MINRPLIEFIIYIFIFYRMAITAAERKRKQRDKIKNDPNLYEQAKLKERERGGILELKI